MITKASLRMKRLLLGASALSGLTVATMPSALAQTAAADAPQDVVIVTGSRIARQDLQSSSPVNVVDDSDILLSGQVNLEAVLNELPAVAPDLTSTTNNGGTGIATVNLRALGANRTLVLVNGRRYVASDNTQQVDINNIPSALIERVEVVTGGASSVYGSDAVAGAVNFILKKDFEGVRVGGQHQVSEEGDAGTYNVNVTVGGNFADGRGNAVVFADYYNRNFVLAAERPWADSAFDDIGGGVVLDPLGSSRIPGSQILSGNDLTLPDGTTGVGSVGFMADGTPFANPASYNFQPDNYIQSPLERVLLSAMANYEISENAEVYFETMYSNSRIDQQLAFDANDIPDNPAALFVPITGNPLITNPDLITFLTDNFDAGLNGDVTAGDGVATIPDIRRRMVEVGQRFTAFDLDSFRVAGGLRGEIPFGVNSDWTYDLFYSLARTNRSESLRGFTSDVRIQQAVNAIVDPNTGLPACADPSGGCVPITLFGPGSIDPNAAGFISPAAAVTRETEQHVINFTVAGTAFEAPAGPVGVALGFEYRDESSLDQPDAFVQSGELGPGTNEDPVSGQFDVFEGYGEVLIPILADQPFAELLEIEGAVRFSDYSSVGFNTSFKGGGSWTPFDGFKIRGLYQRAVRAPNIFELFGQATGSPTINDPCASASTASDASARTFCGLLGVPDPANFIPDAQATTTQRGAILAGLTLSEETATTWTAGFVWEPEFIPGFSLTADYYNIFVDDAINSLGPTTIATLCLQSRDVTSQACSQIIRGLSGNIAQVDDPFVNSGSETRTGVDWQVNYTYDLEDALNLPGQIDLFHIGNYTFDNESVPFDGQPTIDCNGIFGGGCAGLGDFTQPKWRMTNNLTYSVGPFSMRTQVRLIGQLENSQIDTIADLAFPSTPVVAYVDLTFDYEVSENINVYAGVENISNLEPPLMGHGFTGRGGGPDAGTDLSLYDAIGRRFFFGAVLNF